MITTGTDKPDYTGLNDLHLFVGANQSSNSHIPRLKPRLKPRWYGALATSDYAKGVSYSIAYRKIRKLKKSCCK